MSSIAFDGTKTALVLIDLQHVIVGRELHPHSGLEVVQRGARLAEAMREIGGLVVYVRVLMKEMAKLPVDIQRPQPANLPENACDIVSEAGMQDDDVLVEKRHWGAFYATDLDQHLRRRGIKTIILGGIATNFGVESTARAAFDRAYEIVFASDAMSAQNEDMHNFALEKLFPLMGRVRTTDELLGSLRSVS